jgi:hypothetical protein
MESFYRFFYRPDLIWPHLRAPRHRSHAVMSLMAPPSIRLLTGGLLVRVQPGELQDPALPRFGSQVHFAARLSGDYAAAFPFEERSGFLSSPSMQRRSAHPRSRLAWELQFSPPPGRFAYFLVAPLGRTCARSGRRWTRCDLGVRRSSRSRLRRRDQCAGGGDTQRDRTGLQAMPDSRHCRQAQYAYCLERRARAARAPSTGRNPALPRLVGKPLPDAVHTLQTFGLLWSAAPLPPLPATLRPTLLDNYRVTEQDSKPGTQFTQTVIRNLGDGGVLEETSTVGLVAELRPT